MGSFGSDKSLFFRMSTEGMKTKCFLLGLFMCFNCNILRGRYEDSAFLCWLLLHSRCAPFSVKEVNRYVMHMYRNEVSGNMILSFV